MEHLVYRNQSNWVLNHTTPTSRLLGAGLFVVLASTMIAGLFFREQWLWMDEVLSYILLADPSPAHFNQAIVSGIDSNPPLFFNVYWLVGHTISLDPIFLRSLSVLLFAGTITVFFLYTSSLIGNPVLNAVLITLMVYFTHQNFAHSTEIRSYAVLLPISLIYFLCLHQLIDRPTNAPLLILHTLVGALFVYCHNYGLFYLTASGSFFLVLRLWSKDRQYERVLATFVLIGLVWLVGWYPSFRIQSLAGQPHTWIPVPTFRSFFGGVGELIPSLWPRLEWKPAFFGLTVIRVGLVIGLFIYLAVLGLQKGFQSLRQDKAFQFFLLSGFIYLMLLVISLTVSFSMMSVFLSRYMWPSQLLIMFQLLYTVYYFVKPQRFIRLATRWLPVYTILLGGAIFYKIWKLQSPFPSQILQSLPQLKADYPVFVERADYFLPIWFHNHRSNVKFLLDWQTANQPGNILNATVDYNILKSVKDFYGVQGVVNVDKFDAAHFPHFYVVDEQKVCQMDAFIKDGRIKVLRELPINMAGHRLLECTF